MSLALVVAYLTVAVAIELFHDEHCHFARTKAPAANAACHNELCPACMFSAGFNSTEEEYAPVLVDADSIVVSHRCTIG